MTRNDCCVVRSHQCRMDLGPPYWNLEERLIFELWFGVEVSATFRGLCVIGGDVSLVQQGVCACE